MEAVRVSKTRGPRARVGSIPTSPTGGVVVIEFKRSCFGIRLEHRYNDDDHIVFVIMIEDDENWHDACRASSAWLDELISVLQEARGYCATQLPEKSRGTFHGWKFKHKRPKLGR